MQVRTQDADFETQIRRTYSTQLEAIKMYMLLYLSYITTRTIRLKVYEIARDYKFSSLYIGVGGRVLENDVCMLQFAKKPSFKKTH